MSLSNPTSDAVDDDHEAGQFKTGIEAVQTAVVEFDRIAAGIATIEAAHPKNVACDLTSPAGMKQAITGRAAWRTPRLLVEKTRVAAKAPVLALGREIDAFAKGLEARLLEGESNYDEQIKVVERQRAAEAQRKAEEEAARIKAMQNGIASLRYITPEYAMTDSTTIGRRIELLADYPIDGRFEEFIDQARAAKTETLALLGALRQAAVAREAETARLVVERIELDRLRAEAAVREQTERDRQASEQARITAEQRAENDRQAAASAEIEAQAQAQRTEQARLDAKAATLHAQGIMLAAQEADRVERERRELEALAAEAQRKALDAAEQAADRVRNAAPLMMSALQQINNWCCYASEEGAQAHLMVLQQIGVHARAAIASAEGTPTEEPLA